MSEANYNQFENGDNEISYRTSDSGRRCTTLEKGLILFIIVVLPALVIVAVVIGIRHDGNSHVQAPSTGDAGAGNTHVHIPDSAEKYCTSPACTSVAGSILDAMDPTVNPCDDFYQYACGGWIKSHPIPPGRSRWNSFDALLERNHLVIKKALGKPYDTFKSEAEKKAKKLYTSCMDESGTAQKRGTQSMLDLIRSLGGWNVNSYSGTWNTSTFDLNLLLHQVTRYSIFPFFGLTIVQESTTNEIGVRPATFKLRKSWYTTSETIQENEHLRSLLDYMTRIGELLGVPPSRNNEQFLKLIEFEMKLAKVSLSDEYACYPWGFTQSSGYEKMTIKQLSAKAPAIDWLDYFNVALPGYSISANTVIVVIAPPYFCGMNRLLTNTMKTEEGINTLRNYMIWKLVESLVPALPSQFRDAEKELTNHIYGIQGEESRWTRCISIADAAMGFPLATMFVKEAFSKDDKDKAEKMMDEVKTAFKENVSGLSWLNWLTQKAVKDKVDKVLDRIGFPAWINNAAALDEKYKALVISEDNFFQNYVNILKFISQTRVKRLTESVKDQWDKMPQVVDAHYKPLTNEIFIMAGILQPPFYDRQFPKSLNFGALGTVLGHELTHGFDSRAEFGEAFREKTQCFIDQYSKYPVYNHYVNGKATLHENIADNGGIHAAFKAYESWAASNGKEMALPGLKLTHKQLFFLGFSQVFCSSTTKEQAAFSLENDPHTPERYRIIGSLSNSKDFAKQFKCKAGTRMNPVKKCKVW